MHRDTKRYITVGVRGDARLRLNEAGPFDPGRTAPPPGGAAEAPPENANMNAIETGNIVELKVSKDLFYLIPKIYPDAAQYAFLMDAEEIRSTVYGLLKTINEGGGSWATKVKLSDNEKNTDYGKERKVVQDNLNNIQAAINSMSDALDKIDEVETWTDALGAKGKLGYIPDGPTDKNTAAKEFWKTFATIVRDYIAGGAKGSLFFAYAVSLVNGDPNVKDGGPLMGLKGSTEYKHAALIVALVRVVLTILDQVGGGALRKQIVEAAETTSSKAMSENKGEASADPLTPQKPEAKKSGSGEGPSPTPPPDVREPEAKKVREKIADELDVILTNSDEEEGSSGVLGWLADAVGGAIESGVITASTFDVGDESHEALKRYNDAIRKGDAAQIPADLNGLPGWPGDNPGKAAANKTVISQLREQFPARFQEFVNQTGNEDVKALLLLGSSGAVLSPENKITWENITKYAALLGVSAPFEKIARGEDVSKPRAPRRSEREPDEAAEDEPGPGSEGGGTSGGERGGERGKGKKGKEKSVKGTELIALRFTIEGTYKGPEEEKAKAKVRYKFLSSSGQSESKTFSNDVDEAHTVIVGLPWPAEYANYDRISITVSAHPALPDGSPGEQEAQSEVYVIPERGWASKVPVAFNFSQAVDGFKQEKGIPVAPGRTYVVDKPDVTGDVPDYYYDKSGRPKLLRGIDAKCSKNGTRYTFSFTGNKPLIVPIMTASKLTLNPSGVISESRSRQPLNEAPAKTSVPHWIFLTADMKSRGAGGGAGGAGAGAGGGLGAPGPYNVAVVAFSCETIEKWAQVPQNNQAWDAGSLKITLAPRVDTGLKGAAPLLFAGAVDEDDILRQVSEFILGASEIWRVSGLDGLIEHRSVTGPNSLTARQWGQSPSARP